MLTMSLNIDNAPQLCNAFRPQATLHNFMALFFQCCPWHLRPPVLVAIAGFNHELQKPIMHHTTKCQQNLFNARLSDNSTDFLRSSSGFPWRCLDGIIPNLGKTQANQWQSHNFQYVALF